MAAHVHTAIEEYLDRIHREFIWPTVAPAKGRKAPAPDKLDLFQKVLMELYARAVRLKLPPRTPCLGHGDCAQTERCVNGSCVPGSSVSTGVTSAVEGFTCLDSGDCKQDEICIGGLCIPRPTDMSFASVNEVPQYGEELRDELLEYYRRILAMLVNVLGPKPSALGEVRDILMQAYARVAKIAGPKWKSCETNSDCADGEVCVEGVCVPVPFRLVHRPRKSPLRSA